MTQTSTSAAPFTTAGKNDECSWLDLIGWAKGELTALESGMVGASPRQRALSSDAWSAQNEALREIAIEAIRDGVDVDAIMAITHA